MLRENNKFWYETHFGKSRLLIMPDWDAECCIWYCYTEFCYAECRYVECYYAECQDARPFSYPYSWFCLKRDEEGFNIDYYRTLWATAGVNIIKRFSSSLTKRPNKLECLYLGTTFQSTPTFAGNTRSLPKKEVSERSSNWVCSGLALKF